MKTKSLLILMVLCAIAWMNAMALEDSQKMIDPGKPDQIMLDSLSAKPGQSVKMAVRVVADDTTSFVDKSYAGVGSFCIPLKYDKAAMKVDSVAFRNIILKWDAKFANPHPDTGFVSLGGIYTLAGTEKPALITPDGPMEIATLFISINPDVKPGKYKFEITRDPRQGDMYFGSIDGYHSWQPVYTAGIVVVKK